MNAVRLGGMALGNGVLVHGPEYWACAIRTGDGRLQLASGRKPIRAKDANRVVQGAFRMAEVFALLPVVRRRLPEAELPFGRPRVAVAMIGTLAGVRLLRSSRLSPALQEALGSLLALGPAAVAMRGTELAEYHGAEHITIGSYEHGEPRQREHERCGSHLVGPLLITSAAGSFLARRAPRSLRPLARIGAAVGSMAASVEVFGWMVKNERHPVSRALARPGHELQQRVVTAEPSTEQLDVAQAALQECLRLEIGPPVESPDDGDRDEAPPPA
jgi:uncharacterized protein YqhQ